MKTSPESLGACEMVSASGVVADEALALDGIAMESGALRTLDGVGEEVMVVALVATMVVGLEECMSVAEVLLVTLLIDGLIAFVVVSTPLLLVKIMCPGSEMVRFTATLVPRFSNSIKVASFASSVKLLVFSWFELAADTVIGMDLAMVVVCGRHDVTTVMRPFLLVLSAS